MKAIIYHSLSKRQQSKQIASSYEGDSFRILPTKKPIKFVPFQILVYGFMSVTAKPVEIKPLNIDFNQYDEIILVSPIWAGRVNPYMRQFLKDYPFHDKKVTIIGSCNGGYKHYFDSYKGLIDGCNTIIDKAIYVDGIKQ